MNKSLLDRLFSLPYLLVVLAPLAIFAPIFLAGKALFWGTPLLQFVPWWSQAWQMLRTGQLPLWNPLVGMGAPLLANYQSGLVYPPNWVYFFLAALGGTPAIAWGQAVLVALHLAWAGAGMSLLVKRLGLGRLAQAVSGLAFGLSGYLVARSGFLSINSAVAWLPWVIWAATPLAMPRTMPDPAGYGASLPQSQQKFRGWFSRQRSTIRQIVILAAILTLQLLAGHAQITWYTWLLAGMWCGFMGWRGSVVPVESGRWLRIRSGMQGLLGAWARLAVAMLLAVSAAAVQLLPTAEYLLASQRSSAVEYELAMTYSTWPWRLLTLLAPDLFGSPVRGDYWGYGNYWEDALYVGLLPLLLALAAVLRRNKKSDRARDEIGSLPYFLLGLILLAILLALGKNTPVFPWLYRHIPTFGLFQAPARYLIWVEFALALLAGIGVSGWRRPEGRALYWTRLGTAGAFAVSLGAGLAWYLMGDISPSFVRATALAGIWGLGSGALSLLAPVNPGISTDGQSHETSRSVKIWTWSVAIFVAADLVFAGWGLNPAVGLDLYQSNPALAKVPALTAGNRLYLPESDERQIKFERFLRFDTFDPGEDWSNLRAVELPNANILDDLPSANNFDPLVPGRYARWMEALGASDSAARLDLLGLMAVGALERVDSDAAYGVRFDALAVQAARWRWVPCARIASDGEDAWRQVWETQIDFQEEVVLETGGRFTGEPCAQDSRTGSFQVRQSSSLRLEVQVSAEGPGWFVWSDVGYPGWMAKVDGAQTPIYPADYLFRAVRLPAGTHVVVFEYRPVSFWLGLAISLLAWAGLGLVWVKLRSTVGDEKRFS